MKIKEFITSIDIENYKLNIGDKILSKVYSECMKHMPDDVEVMCCTEKEDCVIHVTSFSFYMNFFFNVHKTVKHIIRNPKETIKIYVCYYEK